MQFTPEPLKCHNCGSTNVSITPPWYHCSAIHPLPPEHAQYESLKRSFKKRYIAILLLLALLASIMGVLYFKSSATKAPQSIPVELPEKRVQKALFPNMAFTRNILSGINLFKQTPTGDYLLAGFDHSHKMQFYLLSSNGKSKWHHLLGAAYYIDAIHTKEDGVIITHYQGDAGKLLHIDRHGVRYFFKQSVFSIHLYSVSMALLELRMERSRHLTFKGIPYGKRSSMPRRSPEMQVQNLISVPGRWYLTAKPTIGFNSNIFYA